MSELPPHPGVLFMLGAGPSGTDTRARTDQQMIEQAIKRRRVGLPAEGRERAQPGIRDRAARAS